MIAIARLINALLPASYVADHGTLAWLSLEGLRIWLEYGPGPALVGPVSHTAFVVVALRGDYAAGNRAIRRILAFGEARGYEPGTSQARFLHASLACWSGPLENGVEAARRAREGLLAGGDLAYASRTYFRTVYYQLDSAPSLGACAAEAEAGLAFARRTGNQEASGWLDCCRWLTGVLRGEGPAVAEAAPVGSYEGNPMALFHGHVTAAIAAAIFGDPAGLLQHTEAAMPLLSVAVGRQYTSALARLLRGLALAGQARAADGGERGALLAELDEVTRWLAARAADAPDNFLHLLRLVEAERAWAAGDFRAAGLAYDAARREAAQRQRPWHQALITEHAARFYLAHGLEHVGYELLVQARQQYLAWGATAKVSQLDWAYPALQTLADVTVGDSGLPQGRAVVTTGTIDLLGIVSASQALSSETSIGRLHARVAQVLSAMTGATGVHLLLWDEDRHGWLLPAPDGDGGTVPVSGTGHKRAVPMSVLRYVRRTGEPLVVADATRDDRFARDPYYADVDCCSLLAVPILSRDALRAMLLLENRLVRAAFTTGRLDAVKLIAGQLAVSLDNAQLYAESRQIAGEQAALRRVATLVARAAPPGEVFAAVTEEAGRLLATDIAILSRYAPDGSEAVVSVWASNGIPPVVVGDRKPVGGRNVTSLVFETGQPARIDSYDGATGPVGDIALEVGVRASVGAPISIAGELWGVMIAASRSEPLPADTEARLAGFTELAATAVANAAARAEVSASRARIVAAADQARRRIEQDLHDGAQQPLVTLALRLRAARAAVPPELGELSAELDRAVAVATGALGELREIARGIHPAVLAKGGLRLALNALARRSPVLVHLQVRTDGRLPEPVEVSAYYLVAEALTNAAKHARASAIGVEAEVVGDLLVVAVRDDGVGGACLAGGTGLAGLKDRVEALGGRIVLQSPLGAGTSLRAELPLTAT